MKSRLLILLLLVMNFCFAQITLENTYANTKQFNFRVSQIDENTLIYYLLNDIDNTIEIYDMNHNTIKVMDIPDSVRNGRTYIRALHVSKYLFDSDDEYEYSVSFFNASGATYFYSFYVLNEDGTVLLDGTDFDVSGTVGDGRYGGNFGIFKTLSGDLKLLLSNINSDSSINEVKVYSLPGVNYELAIEENILLNKIGVTPNPTINKQNTIYHNFLNNGKVIIYNEAGQYIKQIKLDRNQKETRVDLSDQASGIYFYQLLDGVNKIGEKKVLLN